MTTDPSPSRAASAALLSLCLVACGGGGDGTDGEPAAGAAVGSPTAPREPAGGAVAGAPGDGCAPVALPPAPAAPVACAPLDDGSRATVLELVNAARAEARSCGTERFEAAPPLDWSPCLEAAAAGHSDDMAGNGFFSHTGSDGSSIGARATAAGVVWSTVGENIAAGQGSAAAAVEGWIASPGHCRNLMNPRFAELGLACAANATAPFPTYWTQVFARSR